MADFKFNGNWGYVRIPGDSTHREWVEVKITWVFNFGYVWFKARSSGWIANNWTILICLTSLMTTGIQRGVAHHSPPVCDSAVILHSSPFQGRHFIQPPDPLHFHLWDHGFQSYQQAHRKFSKVRSAYFQRLARTTMSKLRKFPLQTSLFILKHKPVFAV